MNFSLSPLITKARYHWGGIVFLILFVLTLTSPFIFLRTLMPVEFRGIVPSLNNDDLYYTARVQDSLDGHILLSNPYLWEHKDGYPQQTFLAELILSTPLRIFGLDAAQGRQLSSALLPALIAGLAYVFCWRLLKNRLLAVLFVSFLFFYILPFKMLRPTSPQFNFIFWLTLFGLLWQLARGSKSNKTVLFAILNFGFLFYLYPYYMTYFAAFIGLLVASYFFVDRGLSRKMLWVLLGGIVVGSFYFYYVFQAAQSPYHEESIIRLGMIHTRFPSGIAVVVPCLAVLALYGAAWYARLITINPTSLFMVSGVAAAMIAVNQHIVTGRNLLFAGHFYQTSVFICTFAVAYLVGHVLKKYSDTLAKRGGLRFLFGVFVIVGFLLSGYTIMSYTVSFARSIASEKVARLQDYRSVFEWLDERTSKDSVVFANEEISNLIPIYTHNNIFYSRNANLFILSDQEVLERFIAQNFFTPIDRDFITHRHNQQHVFGAYYVARYGHIVQGNKARRMLGLEQKPEILLPEDKVDPVLRAVAEAHKGTFEDAVKKYRVDYLVWDMRANPDWNTEEQRFLNPVFEAHDIKIYEVR